jgi:hypothetical protein
MTLPKKIEPSGNQLPKAPTGIQGLDEITCGGLPRGRPTLVCGGAGFDHQMRVRAINRIADMTLKSVDRLSRSACTVVALCLKTRCETSIAPSSGTGGRAWNSLFRRWRSGCSASSARVRRGCILGWGYVAVRKIVAYGFLRFVVELVISERKQPTAGGCYGQRGKGSDILTVSAGSL